METDEEGRLLDKNGNVSPGLFTLGPLRIAGLWESIAIPEIRNQAGALVNLLINDQLYEHESQNRLIETLIKEI